MPAQDEAAEVGSGLDQAEELGEVVEAESPAHLQGVGRLAGGAQDTRHG